MKTIKAKKVEPCSSFKPENPESKDCSECSNIDGEMAFEGTDLVSVSCQNRGKMIKVNPPEPEQLSALTIQRVVPDKKISEVGHKAKEERSLDAFDPERQSAEALKVKNLNLF
jgi:hypothetical protein